MTFESISAYSSLHFRRYWKKVLPDPGFKKLLETIRANAPKGQEIWVDKLLGLRRAADFHRVVQGLVGLLIQRTTQGLTWSGTDQEWFPTRREGAVFLSNHRSTSLDAMLINYCLLASHNRGTFNAAGDNIFRTPWLGHIIRLNRGFIVRRQIDDPDQKLVEADRLSFYINKLVRKGKWVWIAHRNGRSKDGTDLTDSSVLAMLRRGARNQEWGPLSRDMPFMPVAVSWELIPLDLVMAQELSGVESTIHHSRDMHNIVNEISQPKGRIHITFQPRVQAEKRNDIVKGLDEHIHQGIRLWESNWLAWLRLQEMEAAAPGTGAASEIPETAADSIQPARAASHEEVQARVDLERGNWILDRAASLDSASLRHFLAMYSAPVERQLEIYGSVAGVLDHQASLLENLSGNVKPSQDHKPVQDHHAPAAGLA